MAADKLSINDPRVEHREVKVRGKNYHYLFAKPQDGPHKATVLLIHGFPDLAMGWRYQVPFLVSQRLQVIVPDQLGYGRTDAPDSPEHYRLKSLSDDLAALLDTDFPSEPQVLVGGHDWGGFLAWRFAEWHPQRVLAVFSVCTPYLRPSPAFIDLPQLVQLLPNFRYQLQFASEELVQYVEKGGREAARKLLNAMYGGLSPEGRPGMVTDKGVLLDELSSLGPARLLAPEELDFYADEFARHGMRGPTNWYRTRQFNFEDERALVARGEDHKMPQPALFIVAKRDAALPPSMAEGMDRSFENLTTRTVDASHWALSQVPDEVNGIIGEFLAKLPSLDKPKASI